MMNAVQPVPFPGGAPCARCGTPMDPSRATYDTKGDLVCPACAAAGSIDEAEGRATKSIWSGAIGIFAAGVLSWTCLNFLWLLSIVTIISAVAWVTTIVRAPHYRHKLGAAFVPCVIGVVLGGILAALPLVFLALGIGGAVLRR